MVVPNQWCFIGVHLTSVYSTPHLGTCLIFNVLFSLHWSRRRSTKPRFALRHRASLKGYRLESRCVSDSFVGTINRHRSSLLQLHSSTLLRCVLDEPASRLNPCGEMVYISGRVRGTLPLSCFGSSLWTGDNHSDLYLHRAQCLLLIALILRPPYVRQLICLFAVSPRIS